MNEFEQAVKARMTAELVKARHGEGVDGLIDWQAEEVNMTLLGELACEEFNGYVGNDIPEFYFEWAFDVTFDMGLIKE